MLMPVNAVSLQGLLADIRCQLRAEAKAAPAGLDLMLRLCARGLRGAMPAMQCSGMTAAPGSHISALAQPCAKLPGRSGIQTNYRQPGCAM